MNMSYIAITMFIAVIIIMCCFFFACLAGRIVLIIQKHNKTDYTGLIFMIFLLILLVVGLAYSVQFSLVYNNFLQDIC